MTKPTKPNINLPEGFALNGAKMDFTEEKIQKGFDNVKPDILAGDNLNKFIDDTYKGLNYSISGIDDLYKGLVLYDANETYSDKSIVANIEDDEKVCLYKSLINENKGNLLTDSTKWQKAVLDTDLQPQKANIDADNFTTTGKQTITNWAFPSSRADILSLGADGETYTAPADGWFFLNKVATAAAQYVFISSSLLSNEMWSVGPGVNCKTFLPVRKGDSVFVNYTTNGETRIFRFVYAEGSK